MDDVHALVIRRSSVLWIGTACIISLLIAAAVLGEPNFLVFTLAATGAFALFGIGFGVWAARKLTRR